MIFCRKLYFYIKWFMTNYVYFRGIPTTPSLLDRRDSPTGIGLDLLSSYIKQKLFPPFFSSRDIFLRHFGWTRNIYLLNVFSIFHSLLNIHRCVGMCQPVISNRLSNFSSTAFTRYNQFSSWNVVRFCVHT